MRRSILVVTGVAGLLALGEGTAHADDPKTGEFIPTYDDAVVEFDYDSGEVPLAPAILGIVPLSIQLTAGFYDNFDITMPGDASYDWSEQQLTFVGQENAGKLVYTIGGDLDVSIKVDIGIIAQDSSILGPFNIELPGTKNFDPYALPGNDTSPVVIDSVLPFEVLEVPFPLGGATGTFGLDVEVQIVGVQFESEFIDIGTSVDENMDLTDSVAVVD